MNPEKPDLPFIVCLECLKKSKEKIDHKYTHSYTILDKLDFPLFEPDWTAHDDITLLKGITSCGIDNWNQISEQLGLKTPEDCEAHFYSFYYQSDDHPIPRIEEIGSVKRDKNHKIITNAKLLESNREKKEKFLEEKKNMIMAKKESRSKSHKNEDENSDDNSKKQGKLSNIWITGKFLLYLTPIIICLTFL
jgi:hypothetical protein